MASGWPMTGRIHTAQAAPTTPTDTLLRQEVTELSWRIIQPGSSGSTTTATQTLCTRATGRGTHNTTTPEGCVRSALPPPTLATSPSPAPCQPINVPGLG